MKNNKQVKEYTALRKTFEFKRFLFWMDKIVDAEKKVNKASMGLISNIPAEELNSLQSDGKRKFVVKGENVERYQFEVSEYCKVHDKLFASLEALEQKFPSIFLSEEGRVRKLGLIHQKETYLRVIEELTPAGEEVDRLISEQSSYLN